MDNGGLPLSIGGDDRVRVIHMPRNRGYGRAANEGLAAADSDAVLVLNQDVVVSAPDLEALMTAAGQAQAWIAGPRLIDGTGRVAPGKQRFPPPLSWTPRPATDAAATPVPWISGAVMLFTPGHTDLRFDERLFMYGEDEELCLRVWAAGGSVVLVDGATMVHVGATAAGARWRRRTITLRTVANRTRIVAWHAGAWAVPRYLLAVARGRAAQQSGRAAAPR